MSNSEGELIAGLPRVFTQEQEEKLDALEWLEEKGSYTIHAHMQPPYYAVTIWAPPAVSGMDAMRDTFVETVAAVRRQVEEAKPL